jgi:hypothetical protein
MNSITVLTIEEINSISGGGGTRSWSDPKKYSSCGKHIKEIACIAGSVGVVLFSIIITRMFKSTEAVFNEAPVEPMAREVIKEVFQPVPESDTGVGATYLKD